MRIYAFDLDVSALRSHCIGVSPDTYHFEPNTIITTQDFEYGAACPTR